MSHYAKQIKKPTCYINSNDFEEVCLSIQDYIRRTTEWNCYGWHDSVLEAKSLLQLLECFGIELKHEYGNYYAPVIKNVYVSMFFAKLIEIVAPYMTKGKIVADDEYSIVTIKFKEGRYSIRYEDYEDERI